MNGILCGFGQATFEVKRRFDEAAEWRHAMSGEVVNMARGFDASASFRDGKGEDLFVYISIYFVGCVVSSCADDLCGLPKCRRTKKKYFHQKLASLWSQEEIGLGLTARVAFELQVLGNRELGVTPELIAGEATQESKSLLKLLTNNWTMRSDRSEIGKEYLKQHRRFRDYRLQWLYRAVLKSEVLSYAFHVGSLLRASPSIGVPSRLMCCCVGAYLRKRFHR